MASPFYNELLAALAEANAQRGPKEQISFRQAVVSGMVDDQGRRLGDSFTTKIRNGLYRQPTMDRLINLSRFLGVHPSRFTAYRERFGLELLEGNPHMAELVTVLSKYDREVASALLEGAVARVRDLIRKAQQRSSGV